MSADKIVTHDDLETLKEIRSIYSPGTRPRVLIDRLIAKAQADVPDLPTGPTGPSWPAEHSCDCGRALPCRHCEADDAFERGVRWQQERDKGAHDPEPESHVHFWKRQQNVTSRGYVMDPIEVCECRVARKADPEPESVTVTLPRDVVKGADWNWRNVAYCLRAENHIAPANLCDALADALEAANTPLEATSAHESDDQPQEAPEGTDQTAHRADLTKEMAAEVEDLLGSGYVPDYYRSLAAGFVGIAENYAKAALTARLAAVEREAKAAAWDEGVDAGHQAARAVNPEWPEQPTNPYRIEREGQA